jgi:phenylalanyl-tRNA synthetase alpha chain
MGNVFYKTYSQIANRMPEPDYLYFIGSQRVEQRVEKLRCLFDEELKAVISSSDLENMKVKYLGRKGPIQDLMGLLKDVAPAQRPFAGKQVNDLKQYVAAELSKLHERLSAAEEAQKLSCENLDITLPGRRPNIGRKHLVIQALDEMIDILIGMGFSVQYGPDIDSDYYNFEALNFPPDHPARDMQDTFYISSNLLLRTHTSNIQARVMESCRPPIRVIAPGKVYRNETITARSHVFFQQIEALYIDTDVTFADLQVTLKEFLRKLFKTEIEVRFRPSYFPFVEPGMEVDVRCLSCKGGGCTLCKQTGWLEVAGAGMVHPEVLKNGDIDPETYTGFAWGLGVERLVMLMYGIPDIRMFTQNDLRFLRQFTAIA